MANMLCFCKRTCALQVLRPFFQDFQITASAGPLGLTTELPPLDRLAVQSVQPGGWAETAGVRAGDLLRALNDVSVDELPPEEFVRLVEFVRPLSMAFSRKISRAQVALKQAFTVEANESVGRLGFKPDSLPPVERMLVKSVDAGGWAEGAGIQAGDALLAVNNIPVAKLQKDNFVGMMTSLRPLQLALERAGKSSPEQTKETSKEKLTETLKQAFTVEANESVGRLGFKPDSLPPVERMLVKSVDAGGWAEGAGIQAGDALLAVNSIPVAKLQKEDFVGMMTSLRPLQLALERAGKSSPEQTKETSKEKLTETLKQAFTVEANAGVGRLGFKPDSLPPVEQMLVKSVDAGGWAEGAGIQAGDALLAVNNIPVAKLQKDNFVGMMTSLRPLQLALERAGKSSPEQTKETSKEKLTETLKQAFTVEANESVGRLGFKPDSLPPVEQMLVKSVDAGGWAEGAGIQAGDALLAVNNIPVAKLQKEDFVGMMTSLRPLQLALERAGKSSPEQTKETSKEKLTETLKQAFTVEANESVGRLGFKPDSLPPVERMLVKSVDAGGWAEGAGIQAGDALLAVNNIPVAKLQKEDFVGMMTSLRPLQLALERAGKSSPEQTRETSKEKLTETLKQAFTVEANESVGRLGFKPDSLPPVERMLVKSVDAGGWAEGAGIQAGDALLAVNNIPVAKLQKDDFLGMMTSLRPLQLALERAGKSSPEQTKETSKEKLTETLKQAFTVEANESVGRLGFKPDSLPPVEQMLVKSVDAGGWAEGAGIQAGDALLAVNNIPVAKLQKEDFVGMMTSLRPLQLTLAHIQVGFQDERATQRCFVLVAAPEGFAEDPVAFSWDEGSLASHKPEIAVELGISVASVPDVSKQGEPKSRGPFD